MSDAWFVEIVHQDSKEVVRRMGPMDKRKAERVEDGVMINMNHENYFTRVVATQPTQKEPSK